MFSFSDIEGGLVFTPIRDVAIFQWKNFKLNTVKHSILY